MRLSQRSQSEDPARAAQRGSQLRSIPRASRATSVLPTWRASTTRVCATMDATQTTELPLRRAKCSECATCLQSVTRHRHEHEKYERGMLCCTAARAGCRLRRLLRPLAASFASARACRHVHAVAPWSCSSAQTQGPAGRRTSQAFCTGPKTRKTGRWELFRVSEAELLPCHTRRRRGPSSSVCSILA